MAETILIGACKALRSHVVRQADRRLWANSSARREIVPASRSRGSDSGAARTVCGEEMHYGHLTRDSEERPRDLLAAGGADANEDASETGSCPGQHDVSA